MTVASSATLYVVGTGPGDPELMTLKATRIIADAPVVAFFAKRETAGLARSIAAQWIRADAVELRLQYPFTTELAVDDPCYGRALDDFYGSAVAEIGGHLAAGRDVVLLCEGDPFFYGSSPAILDRLDGAYACEVIPGVSGMSGCWTRARIPMVHGDDILTVLPGTLNEDQLFERLRTCDSAVIMKIGRNLGKVSRAVARAGLMGRAIYVERGTMNGERTAPLEQIDGQSAPYFALVLIPGRRHRR